ncbi:hypothetical protein S40293_04093 [Stachybotrys chartarum IBT 40293]|nr:hypothetical protein S40293_04093 [Stachybotrys chartarum IBT 40293]
MPVREATPADLPALREIFLAALPDDYQWQYCFPKHGGSEAALDFLNRMLAQCVEPSNHDWHAYVAEEFGTTKVVSVAIWSLVNFAEEDTQAESHVAAVGVAANAQAQDHNIPANTARFAALKKAITQNGNRHLAKYGHQMFLHAIVTHPEYQNLGYAKLICKYLAQVSRERNLAVSVVASPKGYVFYSGAGFSDCGSVSVRVDGENEEILLKSMVLAVPPEGQRRGSLLDRMGHGLTSPFQSIRRLSNAT